MYVYVYTYDRVTLLYSRNWHNLVNQLYIKNVKLKRKKKETMLMISYPGNMGFDSALHWHKKWWAFWGGKVGVGLLAEPLGRAKREARARHMKTVLSGLWTTTTSEESPPTSPWGRLQGSEGSKQWTWLLGPAGETEAPSGCTPNSEEAGEVLPAGEQGNPADFDIFLCNLSPGSAAAVLALGFMPTSLLQLPKNRL